MTCRDDYRATALENAEADAWLSADDDAPTIAALYVEKDGAYFGLPNVDPWDEKRDARKYAGPHPVIAHPPCNKWSPLAYINQKRLPGYHVGDDGGCFEHALECVREFGGVLEHPANSIAWRHYNLRRPKRGSWQLAGGSGPMAEWVTEVDQGAYGHRARKRTWLLYVGVVPPFGLDWSEASGDAIVSGFLHHKAGAYRADERRRVRPKEAAATTPAFRWVLIRLANRSMTGREETS